jgi:hypothetical protein
MTLPTESPAPIGEDPPECADKSVKPPGPEHRRPPVAYEEVTLTEEAAEAGERAHAAAQSPPRKIRRMPTGEPAASTKNNRPWGLEGAE